MVNTRQNLVNIVKERPPWVMRFFFENCGSALIKDFYCDIPDQIQNKKSISAGTFASWFQLSFGIQCKVIHPKYSKHWPYTLTHTIDCVYSEMLNHGLNHRSFLSLFVFLGWKYINWINSGWKKVIAILFQISGFYLKYKLFCPKPAHSYLPKWLCWAIFSNVYSTWDI